MPRAMRASGLGTIIGMIIFAALMVSALGLIIYVLYGLQSVNTELSRHNLRVSMASQAAGSVCSKWIYSPAAGLVEINVTNHASRPARLVGIIVLYGPNKLDAYNESKLIPPGGSVELSLPSHARPVAVTLALLIDDVAVQSSCRDQGS